MRTICRGVFISLSVALTLSVALSTAAADGPAAISRWKTGVKVHPVSQVPNRHTIHSYYVGNPESPDGRYVLYYASTAENAELGKLCVLDRTSGRETVVAKNVHVEDAHRAACQQWIMNGQQVAFHDLRDGRWLVAAVDFATGRERILAYDRQVGFGRAAADVVPIHGLHWNPGEHRDIELLNVSTGEIRPAVPAAAVLDNYSSWVKREFHDQPISLYFGVLSPDLKRIFFKVAAGNGDSFAKSRRASRRLGLIGYDLQDGRLLFRHDDWHHPSWHPDSRSIIQVGNLLIDSNDGTSRHIDGIPVLTGCHIAVSPDGTLFVMDGRLDAMGRPDTWGILVGDLNGGRYEIIHRFDNSHGAKSWRVSHPHPAFSADSRRIYFNVSSGPWTQLFVAEANAPN